jgi:dephospho-CoA kinase
MYIDLSILADNAVVTDIFYTPLATPILKQAKERKLKQDDRLGMLFYQVNFSLELWYDHKPDIITELWNHIISKFCERKG